MKAVDDLLVPEASSKERILRAALTIFSKKSFEGARVDEIARLAGVNKALIYYYFKSKNEILGALFQDAIDDFSMHMGEPIEHLAEYIGSDDAIDPLMDEFLSFIEERRDLFNIAMMELLKESDRRTLILDLLGREIGKQYKTLAVSIDGAPSAQDMITEFFTGLMPIVMFVLLKEPWKELYRQDEVELRQMFRNALKETHIRYTNELVMSRRGKKQV
jgi:TetR/AcrR family transcriptional regulator